MRGDVIWLKLDDLFVTFAGLLELAKVCMCIAFVLKEFVTRRLGCSMKTLKDFKCFCRIVAQPKGNG